SVDRDIPALLAAWVHRLAIAAMLSSNISVRITSGSFCIPTSRTYFAAIPWPLAEFADERRTSARREASPPLMTTLSKRLERRQRPEISCIGGLLWYWRSGWF